MRNFTPTQWDIIEHRLEVSDSIAEFFTDTETRPHDVLKWHATPAFKEVEEAAEALLKLGRKGLDLDAMEGLNLSILKDCCEGCNFFGSMQGAVDAEQLTHQKQTAYHRAADQIGEMIGVPVRQF